MTGRWLSRDPLAENGGVNMYGFCNNDPVNGVDPNGLETYFLNDGGTHANLIVTDPRSKTGYTWYSFSGKDAGWDSLEKMWNSLKTRGIMTKKDFPLDKFKPTGDEDLVRLDTTPEEEECIRKLEDALVALPGIYSSPFRNCATVHRDVLYKAAYLPINNLQGGIYTPGGVAEELRRRNAWRLFWQSKRTKL